jgi:hypothetical protein
MTYGEIINSIETHLSKSTKKFYKDFYIGITDNVDQRLFGYHQVSRTNGWWIYCSADTEEIARQVEAYYLEKGMDGGKGGGKGEGNTKIVYCYEITNLTKERDE